MPTLEERIATENRERLGEGENLPRAADPNAPAESAGSGDPPPDPAVTLQHMDKLLAQIRGTLNAATRDEAHRELSIGRTIGAVIQVVVAGLVALALLDWLLDAPAGGLYIKLAFAGVLQISALTAFVVSRPRP